MDPIIPYIKLDPYEICVLDDIIHPDQANFLEEYLISVQEWKIGSTAKGTSGFSNESAKKYGVKNIYEQFQLCANIINKPQDIYHFNIAHYFLFPLLSLSITEKYCWSINDILRIKANLQTRAPHTTKNTHSFPHMDFPPPGNDDIITFLYYVNDSDGDTYFFKDKIDDIKGDPKDLNNLNIIKQVSPKKGRLVMFRGDILHAGSNPINSNLRIVINYNLRIKSSKNFDNSGEYQLFNMLFPNHNPA